MKNQFQLSILVPVRNGELHLSETLNKICQATHADIVVSNNLSTDSTLDILNLYPKVRVVHPKESLTMIGNWNFVTGQARGDYYKLVSHDDLIDIDTLYSQKRALDDNPEAVFAYSKRNFLFETPKRKILVKTKSPKKEKLIGNTQDLLRMVCKTGTNPIGETLCVTFRKSKMSISNSWKDIEMIYELQTYADALRLGPAIFVPGNSGSFRIHTRSYSASIGDYFLLAKSVRNWVISQPESSELTKTDLVVLEFMSRFVAFKKQVLFKLLKAL